MIIRSPAMHDRPHIASDGVARPPFGKGEIVQFHIITNRVTGAFSSQRCRVISCGLKLMKMQAVNDRNEFIGDEVITVHNPQHGWQYKSASPDRPDAHASAEFGAIWHGFNIFLYERTAIGYQIDWLKWEAIQRRARALKAGSFTKEGQDHIAAAVAMEDLRRKLRADNRF